MRNIQLVPNQTAVTSDYDLFKRPSAQRPLNEAHIRRIVASMKERGFLQQEPIFIDAHWNVTNGQHRLEAARRLGLPVYYIYVPNYTANDAAALAKTARQWTLTDYVSAHASENDSSQFAVSVAKEYGHSLSTVANITGQAATAVKRPDFHLGADQREFILLVLNAARDFSFFECCKYSQFVLALKFLLSQESYNHNRMLRKLKFLSTKVVRCATVRDYVVMLSDIYNYKEKAADVIDFASIYYVQSHRKSGVAP